jgi:hypothetical protein
MLKIQHSDKYNSSVSWTNQTYAGAALNYDHATIQIERDLNSSKYLSYAEKPTFYLT